jgi:hypothetical protein
MFKRRRNRNSDAVKFLGFYPETVAARVRAAAAPPRLLTLGRSLGFGAGGFCLIIVIVMAMAAVTENFLKKYLGDKGSYAFNILLFILMAGGVFRRLVIAPAPVFRVYVLFAAAFFLYDVAWTAAYRPFRNVLGEWLGSLAGGTGLGLVLATVFDAPKQAVKVILVLCVTSSSGYFGGKFLHQYIPGIVGALVWGAGYGLGLGTGLGYALYACQEPARQRLKRLSTTGTTASSSRRFS